MYCSRCKYLLNIQQRKLTLSQQLLKTINALKNCEKVLNVTHKYGRVPEWAWIQYRFDLKEEIKLICQKK